MAMITLLILHLHLLIQNAEGGSLSLTSNIRKQMEGMISLTPQENLQLNSTYSGSQSLDPEKFMDANVSHY